MASEDEGTEARWLLWAYRLGFVLLVLVSVAAALHEIANFWSWGHNGYNGAAFSQAGRNSLRFAMVGQAQYWTAPSPPPVEAVYTHHPLLLNIHVAFAHAVFGDSEWAARTVPAAYAVLGPIMLFVLVRRFWGRAVALASMAVYVFLPITLIYNNMVNHEQGSVFWLLVMLYGYLRWLEARSRRWLVFLLLATSVACQFDWPPYYVAFFVAVHAASIGLRRIGADRARGQSRVWAPELSFVAVFSAVVLINFFGFFAWIYSVRGSLSEMAASFQQRAGTPADVWTMSLGKLPDMMQPLAMALAVLWLLGFLVRLGRGEARHRDLIPIAFLLAQVIHQSVFKVAGHLHVYWLYHGAPFVAVGAGVVAVWAFRAVARWAMHGSNAARITAMATAIVVGLGFSALAVSGVEKMLWARSLGSAPYRYFGNPFRTEGQMAAWLASQTAREEAVVFDDAISFRVEVLWYLDRPTQKIRSLAEVSDGVHGFPVALYVVEVNRTPFQRFGTLVNAGHALTLLNDRWLVIDLRRRDNTRQARALEEQPAELWWKFFVNRHYPPLVWVRDPVGSDRVLSLGAVH